MLIILEENKSIKGVIENVYENCLFWLDDIKATIITSMKPSNILAEYNDPYVDDKQNSLKTIEITLKKSDLFTDVNITIKYPEEKYVDVIDADRIRFFSLLNFLWSSIDASNIVPQIVAPLSECAESVLVVTKKIAITCSFVIPICVYQLFYPISTNISGIILLLLFSTISLILRELYKVFRIYSNLVRVYPSKIRLYRFWIVFYLIIVLITPASVGLMYYLGYGASTVNSFDVYSNYGFTFSYPKSMVVECSSLDGLVSPSPSEGKLIAHASRGLGQKEGIILQWVKMPGPGYDKTVLPNSLDVEIEGVSSLSPVRLMNISEIEVYYRSFILNSEGEVFCHMGVWYVHGQERIYLLMYTNTKNITAPIFSHLLESFKFDSSING